MYTILIETEAKNPNKKKQLLAEDNEKITLVINLQKIPHTKAYHTKVVKIPLSHSIYAENTSICLFVKDINKKNDDLTIHQIKEELQSKEITTPIEVLTLHQLITEYKPHETKRNLCNSHDLFLTDSRITAYLPKFLGREFWQKKKLPVKVNMKAKDLTQEFKKVLSSTFLHLNGRGSTCVIPIAKYSQGNEKILENLIQAMQELPKAIPGGWKNVRGLYIKTLKSIAIPVYLSPDSPNGMHLKVAKVKKPKVKPEELSTKLNTKVKVLPKGNIKIYNNGEEEEETDEEMDFRDLIEIKKRKTRFGSMKERVKRSKVQSE